MIDRRALLLLLAVLAFAFATVSLMLAFLG